MKRTIVGEIMDAPDLDRAEHLRALDGLRRINNASGVAEALASHILNWTRSHQTARLRMLDVACGGGDVPLGVVQRLKAHDIQVQLTVIDRSSVALERAQAAAREHDVPVQTLEADAVQGIPIPPAAFDIVTNSLFLHHLERDDAIRVLRHMHAACRGLLIISDLRRSRLGWAIAWAGCRILSRSPVVHFDGPASVRAAWTPDELRHMAHEAGMTDAAIHREWPWRMGLLWEPRHSIRRNATSELEGAAHVH